MLNELAGLGSDIALFALQVALLAAEGICDIVNTLLGLACYLAACAFHLLAHIWALHLALAQLFVLFAAIPACHFLPPRNYLLTLASLSNLTESAVKYRAISVPASSVWVLGVGCWVMVLPIPNTQHPTPNPWHRYCTHACNCRLRPISIASR